MNQFLSPPCDRPSVLIVDDDPDIRTILHDLLEYDGYHVEEASTCGEALRQTQVASFATVLLDMGLPDGDGLSLMSQLQNIDPLLPVIILSAYASSDYRRHAHSAEVFSWLAKPYDRDELLAVVRQAVERGTAGN